MPIIGKVGQKSLKVKTLVYGIHIVLLLGSITMVYPFMIMLSASFSSGVDSKKFSVIPKFFTNQEIQFKKYLEARYNDESTRLANQTKGKFIGFDFVNEPKIKTPAMYNDWLEFIKENKNTHNAYDFYVSEQYGRQIFPRNEREFRNKLKAEYNNDISLYNKAFNAKALSWDEIKFESKNILNRNFKTGTSKILQKYNKFAKKLPIWHRAYASLDSYFVYIILLPAYQNNINKFNTDIGTNYNSWDEVILPKNMPNNALKKHWVTFVKNIVNISKIKVNANGLQSWQNFLQNKYEDINLLNKTFQTNYANFNKIEFASYKNTGAIAVDWIFFVENIVKPEFLSITSVELDFRKWLQNKYRNIENLNKKWYGSINTFYQFKLTTELPKYNQAKITDWIDFYKNYADLSAINIKPQAKKEFITFLYQIYPKKNNKLPIDLINKDFGLNYKTEEDIYPSLNAPENKKYYKNWRTFVYSYVSPKFVSLNLNQQKLFEEFLENKYHSIEKLKSAYLLKKSSFDEISIDWINIDWHTFINNKKVINKEFAVRNYSMVLDVLLYNGKAIFNTLIYVILAIGTALLINPMAAYALSRFKMKATYKILLVLMLTMAFPPMVMGIPNFLLLKNLSLLNTFWALILPAAADGYFIFLLKGFFDSLPKELFENAMLEGASEMTLFFRIAMPLSKPIMAVIALGAFNAAYRNFMFAFIVCQDKSMWTLMVHLYQLMQRSTAGVGYAALVIAAIPTFAVFVFFQNIIIKGIVVPTEK